MIKKMLLNEEENSAFYLGNFNFFSSVILFSQNYRSLWPTKSHLKICHRGREMKTAAMRKPVKRTNVEVDKKLRPHL